MIVWVEGDVPGLVWSAKALKMFKPYLSLGEERRPRTEKRQDLATGETLKVTQSRETLQSGQNLQTCYTP